MTSGDHGLACVVMPERGVGEVFGHPLDGVSRDWLLWTRWSIGRGRSQAGIDVFSWAFGGKHQWWCCTKAVSDRCDRRCLGYCHCRLWIDWRGFWIVVTVRLSPLESCSQGSCVQPATSVVVLLEGVSLCAP